MAQAPATPAKGKAEDVECVIVVSYPKIIFLYPTLILGLITALYLSFTGDPLDPQNKGAVVLNTLFLGVFGINLVVLAFDFPRTTSLTMFFCAAAIVLGCVLLFTLKPELLPALTAFLVKFRPLANATFYWALMGILGALFAVSFLTLSFDYWEVRANEILHHHGFLSNLTRRATPNLRLDNEINDLFEYMLLRSGRLILQPSNERPIVLENVPFIKHKERQIMNLLGALKVEIREEGEET